jgi:hypothetical protein
MVEVGDINHRHARRAGGRRRALGENWVVGHHVACKYREQGKLADKNAGPVSVPKHQIEENHL